MLCPYCDSVLTNVQGLSNCPHCNAVLPDYQGPEEKRRTIVKTLTFPDPPIGKYKDADGYLEIGTDSITIFSRPFLKGYKRTIPFHSIYAVSYEEGKPFHAGFLCVREWKDRHLPLMTNVFDAVSDETSLYFREEWNNTFRKVYDYLKELADINRQSSAFQEPQKKEAELSAAGILFCPACFSTSVQSVRALKPYIHRPYVIQNPKLQLINSIAYLIRVMLQIAEPETFRHTCSSCGHRWTSQKK